MPRLPGRHFAVNLVQRRALLFQLVRRDFHQRFVGSAAGWLWGVLHPLVLLFSYYFVFQICLRTPMPKNGVTQSYALLVFCGFLPWLLFSETVLRSANSLLDHANLITKTVFPSEIVPVAIFLSSLLNHLMALALGVAAVGIVVRHLSPMMVFLPVYMLLAGLLAIGIGWIVASLQVYLRDTTQVLQVVMTLWFWVTPILITEQQIPERYRFLVALNPLAYLVTAYRDRMLSPDWPSMRELTILAAWSIAAFLAGGLFFRHLKRGFADVL